MSNMKKENKGINKLERPFNKNVQKRDMIIILFFLY